jgi:hypothetical protein
VTDYNWANTAQKTNGATGTGSPIHTKSALAIAVNDVIKIDNEYMLVTGIVSEGGTNYSVSVTRGWMYTTPVSHNDNKTIAKGTPIAIGTSTVPRVCTVPDTAVGTVPLQPGTYYGGICIGTDDCTGTNCTMTAPTFAAYSPTAQKTFSAIPNATDTTVISTGSAVSPGDTIRIDSEYFYVVSTADAGGGTETLTVLRGYLGTTAANHAANANILQGTAVPGPTVNMAAGTYIIAGGGFKVCGSAILNAPNVMIYNTNDQVGATVYKALDQVLLNTSGAVTLGAQTTGTYAGMTIFQNRSLVKNTTDSCDSKAQDTKVDDWDIGFASMGATGANGSLGSVTGTIYAANDRALFTDMVSGTSKIAVLTGCIYVNGATSTFDFDTSKLYGNGLTFLSQSG